MTRPAHSAMFGGGPRWASPNAITSGYATSPAMRLTEPATMTTPNT